MKPNQQAPKSRREKVVDSMAKKFADRGSVQQIIIRHRKRMFRSTKTLYSIIAVTVTSMVITALLSTGVVETPAILKGSADAVIEVKSPLELLKSDLASSTIGVDQFVLYCKDYLNRYDSLPVRYQTPFSVTTSDEVYRAIAEVWPTLNLRTRQVLLKDLPYIETVQKQLLLQQQQALAGHDSTK